MTKLHANWSYPTAIRFGEGRLAELPEACQAVGLKNPLFVTDRGLADLEITAGALKILQKTYGEVKSFAEVDANPTDENLKLGLQAYKDGKHDGVIVFGGGSAMDLGKLLAFMAGQSRPVWDFEDIGDYWKRADSDAIAPIVAVPTTSGTGSEVGRASVLTDSTSHLKKIIFHPKILPSVVICDPTLATGLPPHVTAGTGMDAFIHSFEAYCTPSYHPLSQGIAIEGMRLVKENLLTAYKDGGNLQARANMMSAAAMGATAFQKGLGAVHALSHPVSALYNTPHGMTNAVILPTVLRFNRQAIEQKLESIAAYLSIDGGADGFIAWVDDFSAGLKIPKKLTDLGADDKQLPLMSKMAVDDPSAAGNPIAVTPEICEKLYRKLF